MENSDEIAPKRQKMKPNDEENGNFPKIFDMRPDRLLLDPNFYGYKLSLDPLPTYSKSLESSIDYAKPTAEQYSLQHVKLQVFSNHLFPDIWSEDTIYYIDVDWNVLKCSIDHETRNLGPIKKVWTVPRVESKLQGRFNISLLFPSEEVAILCDGCGNIYVLNTGKRNDTAVKDWKVGFTGCVFENKKNPQFILLDALCYSEGQDGKQFLDVLLLRIDEKSEWADFLNAHKDIFHITDSTFVSLVEWITFTQDSSANWSQHSNRTLLSLYGLHYASVEEGGKGVYIASDGPVHFAFDSENTIVNIPEAERVKSKKQDKNIFVWAQTMEEITVWFRLPEDAKKHDLSVLAQPTSMKVEYQDNLMLEGDLFNAIKADETVWTFGTGKLEITLSKAEKNLMWKEFIPGNCTGEEIVDPELVEQIHQQLAHLCSDKWGADPHRDVFVPGESEECDELPADTSLFMRIDRKLQKVTDQASLGSHQWLFNIRTSPKTIPSICLRHDVDGIVWKPNVSLDKDQLKFNCEHIGTFSAIGYVQASKELRKFTVCSPDLSYVAICDTVKHIHVYRQPSPIENDLRNRKTGEKVSTVCKQQVIAIDPPEEIMGGYAGNEFLFVLTSKNLHAVQMKAVEIA